MIPEEFREFFVAAAGAAGALIGLLFVAVSVFPEQARQATTRADFNSRASAALLAFTNALVMSLAALVPGVSLGWWAIVAGVTVLLFAAGTVRSAASSARRSGHWAQAVWLVAALVVIGGWEVYAGVTLIAVMDPGALQTLNYVIIGDLAFGIARAWQLLGLRDTGVLHSMRLLAGHDRDSARLKD